MKSIPNTKKPLKKHGEKKKKGRLYVRRLRPQTATRAPVDNRITLEEFGNPHPHQAVKALSVFR